MKFIFLPAMALALILPSKCESGSIAPQPFEGENGLKLEGSCEDMGAPAYEVRRWEKMNRGTYCEAF